ncbi:MAG: hypothetical protein K0R99_4900 [Microbacterium sp.]|uniref:hypothetical protein n=1 Tax=Microbacterium sp. TaxID=51671 RepID=UPI00261F832A|nr:hypothetical protein [Microbacterium sp.]MDF2563454.1 hypothetical protein [Microbacterium sp.]
MSDDEQWDGGELDGLLRAARPPRTVVTPSIEDELARMTVAAGGSVVERDRPRRVKHAAALGVALAVLLGGAGAAAAATIGEWSWWAEDPDGKYYYTAPTGESCEVRIGKIESPYPEVEAMMRDIQGRGVVLDEDDIAAAFVVEKQLQHDYEADQRAQGKDLYVQPDPVVYELAVYRVIQDYVDEKLAAQGIDLRQLSNGAFELGTSGEITCSAVPGE